MGELLSCRVITVVPGWRSGRPASADHGAWKLLEHPELPKRVQAALVGTILAGQD
jgi:hypothetical protein